MAGMEMRRLDSAMMNRAALGMQLSATGSVRDTLGVFVAAVTPKGPAENAGVVEGDRIVSINGVDLRVAAGDVEDGYASGLPSHRLSREVGKLTPGSRVNLRVYSGGRVRDVQVTAGRASDLMKTRFFGNLGENGPGNVFIYRDGMPEMPPMPPMAEMRLMPGMGSWDGMPGFEWRSLPRMRMLEGQMGRTLPSRVLVPRGTIRLRAPLLERGASPLRVKVEKEQKAKADSLKKTPRK
jgi:PDZ domain